MFMFEDSEKDLAILRSPDLETQKAPEERLASPEAARTIHRKNCEDDEAGSYNRSLVQGQMDFMPPHDDDELENKGQSDRFNITTGEGPVIKNEAVAAYLSIFTTPKQLVQIPLNSSVDRNYAETWGSIMAEEFTIMERSDDNSLPLHLQLADIFVTHGVAIGFFDDPNTMQYSVSGLDNFKFPRNTGIVSSKVELVSAEGEYGVTELWSKIKDLKEDNKDGWNVSATKRAITTQARNNSDAKDWHNWEEVQREIKANEHYVNAILKPVEVIHMWVKEYDGSISYYICEKNGPEKNSQKGHAPDEFLYRKRSLYNNVEEAFQIFAFSVGNGGKLYTVRGLGYLIYQLCNAMDIMHCKLLDNARIGSSLIVQAASSDDVEDLQLIDFGGGVALPPTMRIPEQRMGQDLSRSLVPAIDASRSILNRATGGLASGSMMLNPEQDRRTKLEVSAQLDYINKLNSFAISLFYGPYDSLMREKVRRAFSVRQQDPAARERVNIMKKRCLDRGVPEMAFKEIDFKSVTATRIIGTGSRASRVMLMDQLQQMYSTWDAVGRKNFEYDYLVELVGVDKAERYAGRPSEKRLPYDTKIAMLENMEMLEGDYVEPQDGEDHLSHLEQHLNALEMELQDVDEGQLDMMEWTTDHLMIYRHTAETLEMTTVHEMLEPKLNEYRQRAQQVGEIVTNGLKMINKAKREGRFEEPEQGQENQQPDLSDEEKAKRKHQMELEAEQAKHRMSMQHEMEKNLLKIQALKQAGQQKMVNMAQEAMAKVATRDNEVKRKLAELRARSI